MRIEEWTHDLPARLELAAETIDDLANGVWVQSDEHRERLFSVEAQLWRIAQTVRRRALAGDVLSFLDRSLRASRSNVRLCQKLPVSTDEEGIELLQGVGRVLDEALAELATLRLMGNEQTSEPHFEPHWRIAAGGRS